jgi:hypothetical protein
MVTRARARASTLGGLERFHLIEEREEPQPGLPRSIAGFVHDSPLVSGEVLSCGKTRKVAALSEEQEAAGVVHVVEVSAALQDTVQGALPCHVR